MTTSTEKPAYKKPLVIGAAVAAVALAGFATYDIVSTMPNPERDARESCERQVTAQAKYPGSVDFVLWGTRDPDNGDGTYTYSGSVDFANGYGTPVRHFFTCKINGPGEVDAVEVVSLS